MIARTLSALLLLALLAGCATKPRIRIADTRIHGTPQQDQPATLERNQDVLPLPAGTTVEARTDGTKIVTLPSASSLTTTTQRASTGGTSQEVARHRIDSDRREKLARAQMMVGIGLMVAGVIVGFALPGALRWPQVGIYVAGIGLVLVILRDPPTWLIALLSAAAFATVVTFYSTSRPRN
jgi:hypothetical protein